MMKITRGDLFTSKMKTLVNAVNCVGVMGGGIALAFKKRYPEMYEDYVGRCERSEVKVGVPYVFNDASGKIILNFPTLYHWTDSSELSSIEKGLDLIVEKYKEWGLESIAIPALGCGVGGLSWEEVGPLMREKLSKLEIPVEIYEPL
ncbi:MAG: macro domain-containing protein [Candidatus Cloacimonadia bacterium]